MKRAIACALTLACALTAAISTAAQSNQRCNPEEPWREKTTATLAAQIENVSATFAAFIHNTRNDLTHRESCPSDELIRTMRGMTTYVPIPDSSVSFTTDLVRTDTSVTWIVKLAGPVKVKKPGVPKDRMLTEADFETMNVTLDADRLEVTVQSGAADWHVYQGEKLLGTGSVPFRQE